MKRHRIFLALTGVEAVLLAALLFSGNHQVTASQRGEIPALRRVVGTLQLTDLAIWTEARYARHLSQADAFTPFQDFPSALEHFPVGSIIAPPGLGALAPMNR